MVRKLTWVIRILLGFVFLFSSASKIADPAAFAAIVNNYQLLSPKLVLATALVLPWIEALCGLALVFGRFENGALMLVCLMMVGFTGLILYNGYRGLDIACGCFSLAAKAPSNIAANTLRNLLILGAGLWVILFSRRWPTTPVR
jgi:uncharacterized membrane protein YphA (DoxX/SURF4 family)